jgi:hypothetical protein
MFNTVKPVSIIPEGAAKINNECGKTMKAGKQ